MKRIVTLPIVGVFLLLLILSSGSYAAPQVSNNNGTWFDNYIDSAGVGVVNAVTHNPSSSIMELTGASGDYTTVPIIPTSFDQWDILTIDATTSTTSDLTIDILDASTGAVLFAGVSPVGGQIDLDALGLTSATAGIQVKVNLSKNGPTNPSVNSLDVTWNPVSLLLIDFEAQETAEAGNSVTYEVRYSVNYVEARDLVIWSELPENGDGATYLEPYGQDDSPSYSNAAQNGLYCPAGSGGCLVNGTAVPENAVYWDLGTVSEGTTALLTYGVSSPNGTLNGTQYTTDAFANASNADQVNSAPDTTIITSTPNPNIDKRAQGPSVIPLPTDDRYYAEDGTPVTFIIADPIGSADGNTYSPSGVEDMYNTVIWDDVSDLEANIVGGGSAAGYTNITGGGVYDPAFVPPAGGTPFPAIVWDSLGVGADSIFEPGATFLESFDVVLLNDPVVALEMVNTTCIDSDQTTAICADVVIETVPDETVGNGIFAKGDDLNNVDTISAGINDDSSLFTGYGSTYEYLLTVNNNSLVTVTDVLMIDMIPDTVSLSAAYVSDPNANETIFYYTGTGFADPLVTPPTTVGTLPASLGAGWSTTPPANLGDTTWIAFFFPETGSRYVPAGNPNSQWIAHMEVDVDIPQDPCVTDTIDNYGHFAAYGAEPFGGGAPNAIELTYTDHEITMVEPERPQLNISGSGVNITPDPLTDLPGVVRYTAVIRNENEGDLSTTAQNVRVELQWTQINVNGMLQFMDFVNANGGTIETFDPVNGRVVINIGTLLPNQAKTITLDLSAPQGTLIGEQYSVNAIVTGEPVENPCLPDAVSLSKDGAIAATAVLQVVKEDALNLIPGGDLLEYVIKFNNIGDSPTTDTFVVDRLPLREVFEYAYAPNGETVYFTDKTVPDLPLFLDPTQPLDGATIAAHFTPGTLNDGGTPADFTDDVWTSPFGETTTWLAYKVDDPLLTPNLFPVGETREVSFVVRNDEDSQPPQVDSGDGTLLFNEVGIFSAELLQAVGNEVRTTISEDPGLYIDKEASSDIVVAGIPFEWVITYYNDSGTADSSVTIQDTLPAGITYNGATHDWNAVATANGASGINAGTVPSLVTMNPDGTTTLLFEIAGNYRGGNLAPEEGGSITLDVVADPALVNSGDLVVNTACGTAVNPNGTTYVCDEDVVEVQNPDLTITKVAGQTDPASGDTVTYLIAVSNIGGYQAVNAVLVDTFPTGMSYVANSVQVLTPGWSLGEPTVSGQTLTWQAADGNAISDNSLSPADPGYIAPYTGPVYFTYQMEVAAGIEPGTALPNTITVDNDIPEEDEDNNEDDEEVITPYPDPEVTKDGPDLIDRGGLIEWTVSYGNFNNEDAENVYLIDTLPDWNGDTAVDLDFFSTSANGPSAVTVYYSDAAVGSAPAFTSGSGGAGWTTSAGSLTNPVSHIAYDVGDLPRNTGPFEITIKAFAQDPVTGELPPAGTTYLNDVEIFTSSEEDDPTNNQDDDPVQTPNVDLALQKEGSAEGFFPGVAPGASLVYTITYQNLGTVTAYGVVITDSLPAQVFANSPAHNFNIVAFVDGSGSAVSAVDTSDNAILTPIPVTFTQSGQDLVWKLGSDTIGDPIYYRDVGMPAGAEGSFQIFVTIDPATTDSTIITNLARISTDKQSDDAADEELLTNNPDDSTVIVYQADVFVNKSVVDFPTGDEFWTESGSILEYTIEYGNSGNIDAENVVIYEIVPEGTTIIPDSLLDNLPPNTYVEPVFGPDGSTIVGFELHFVNPLPAPSTFWGQSTFGEWQDDTIVDLNLNIKTKDENAQACLVLDTLGGPFYRSTVAEQTFDDTNAVTRGIAVLDADGDGDLDMVTTNFKLEDELHLNDGTGVFTPTVSLGTVTLSNGNRTDVIAADIDNDGDDDLIFSTMQENFVMVNDGTGVFTGTAGTDDYSTAINSTEAVVAFDANGDGNIDLLAGNESTNNVLYLGDGTGNFTAAADQSDWATYADATQDLQAVDINGDGTIDIIEGNSKEDYIYLNDGTGAFTRFSPAGQEFDDPNSVTYAVEAFDVDGDGDLDIAVGSPTSNQHKVYLNDGTGVMTLLANSGDFGSALISRISALTSVDIDLDGDIDLIAGFTSAARLYVNDGTGIFTADYTFSTGASVAIKGVEPHAVVAFDANGDGDADVGVGTVNSNHFHIQDIYVESGSVTSTPITPTVLFPNSGALVAWSYLVVDQVVPDNTTITYDVLDASGNAILSGLTPDQYGRINIASLDPVMYPVILLRGNLANASGPDIAQNEVTPQLCAWNAVFQMEKPASFTFQVIVDDPVTAGQTTVDNIVNITTDTPETDPDNNDDDDTINIIFTDPEVEKEVDESTADPGDTLVYTIDYTNNGPHPSINTIITDTMPTGVTVQSFSGGGTQVSTAPDVVVWNIGDLAVNEGATLYITVTVNVGTEGSTLLNTVTIGNDRQEVDYNNNDDDAVTFVGDAANIYIEKDGPASIELGEIITYTLTYGNDGNLPAENVGVEDILPDGVTFIDAIPAITNLNSNVLGWNNIGTLNPGGTGTILVVVQVSSDPAYLGVNLRNVATTSTTTPEVTLEDNTDDHENVPELDLAAITGYVWHDVNEDVVFDPSEDGIEGVLITLTGIDIFGNSVVMTTTTAADGSYAFTNLYPGDYTLTETQPAPYLSTGSSVGSEGGTNNPPDQITDITLESGDLGLNYNFGEDYGVSIGDTVWADTNADGVQDGSESGIPNVLVYLFEDTDNDGVYSTGDTFIDFEFTDADGNYTFDSLDPGDYIVVIPSTNFDTGAALDGLVNSVGSDDPDSNPANDDDNGLPAFDGGVASTAVTLTIDGEPTDDGDGDDDSDLTVDFGFHEPVGSIGDTIWGDLDYSGGDQSTQGSEPGLDGVTVSLTDENGVTITTTTSITGYYLFEALPMGTYTITVDTDTLPDGYSSTSTHDGTDGGSDDQSTATLTPDAPDDFDQDFSYPPLGSIGDTIWGDLDLSGGDQSTQGSEPGLDGVTVSLTDENDVTITTTTSITGYYLFDDLPLGTYTITVDTDTLPDGYLPTSTHDGTDGGSDDQSVTTLTPDNQNDDEQDFSYPPVLGSIGDTIWGDLDSSGGDQATQGSEPGLEDVVVILTASDGSTMTMMTDADGNYLFEDLPLGTYTITVDTDTLPDGYIPTSTHDGTDGGNDDQSTAALTSDAPDDLDQDFSYPPVLGSIGDTIFHDADGDGNYEPNDDDFPLPNVEVILTDSNGVTTTTMTDENGNYLFEELPLGDYTITVNTDGLPGGKDSVPSADPENDGDNTSSVSLTPDEPDDLDQDFGYTLTTGAITGNVTEDTDNDGTGDVPMEDIVILLLDENGTLVDSTTTDENGDFIFPEVIPGDYTVVEVQPEGYDDVTEFDGGDDGDHPDNGITNSIPVTVSDDETDTGNDFVEEVAPTPPVLGAITGNVSEDTNNDDSGDVPIESVILQLVDANGDVVMVTATDENGDYAFLNVTPGDYTVVELQPAGYDDVTEVDGGDDSDHPDNGTVNSIPVTVDEGETDTGNDFVEEVEPVVPVITGAVTGNVSEDTNDDDDGDVSLENVVLQLIDENGDVVMITITDENGDYAFTDVTPGDYTVVELQPAGYDDVTEVDGGDDSDHPDNGIVNSIPVTVSPNETDTGNDFVEEVMDEPILTATITGNVTEDTDDDDSGDVPLENVVLQLVDENGTLVMVTTTDENGDFVFTDVIPGTYTVVELQPAGYDDVTEVDGGDDSDHPDNGITNSIPVTVIAGETDTGNDFVEEVTPITPVEILGSIGDTIFFDANGDGIYNPVDGDEPLDDVVVILTDADGNQISTLTDEDGYYLFPDLPLGTYTVDVYANSLPGYVSDTPSADPESDGNNTSTTTLTADTPNDPTQDFGYPPVTGSIGDTIFHDADHDGVYDPDAGDFPLPNVEVILTDSNGMTTSVMTDENGNYLFEDLPMGNYTVSVNPDSLPDGKDVLPTADPDNDGNNTSSVTLTPDTPDNHDQDFGYTDYVAPTGAIAGNVTEDTDGDGVGDTPIAGVVLQLFNGGSDMITTTTDANGDYLFTDVLPGEYVVVEVQPDGYANVTEVDGGDDADHADNGVTNSIPVTVSPNETDTGNDFVEELIISSISGNVTEDSDGDGMGDTPIVGVVLELLDSDGNVVQTTMTDGGGNYLFTDVAPGAYTISEQQPAGYDDVTEFDGGDDADHADNGIINNIPVTLDEGENDTGNDFVEERPGAITGTVTEDINDDDSGDVPIAGVTVHLLDEEGSIIMTTTTDENGEYAFTNVSPGNYTVVEEQPDGMLDVTPNSIPVTVTSGETSEDNDFVEEVMTGDISGMIFNNEDGGNMYDSAAGDFPMAFVVVRLTNSTGNEWTALTNSLGEYQFTDMPLGDYTLTVADESLPDSKLSSPTADPDQDGDNSTSISLTPDAPDTPDQDFGYPPLLGQIGETIFHDDNHNGVYDPANGDYPLANVTVMLIDESGITRTATTDESGYYMFDDLPLGLYTVIIEDGSLPEEKWNIPTAAPDQDGDNRSTILLTPSNPNNNDQNFGYEQVTGAISGYVIEDVDKDGTGDAPLSNVSLSLFYMDGRPVVDSDGGLLTVVTDENGFYIFPEVLPGDYLVAEKQPYEYLDVSEVDGGTDADHPDNGVKNSIPVTVSGNEQDIGNDFVEVLADPTAVTLTAMQTNGMWLTLLPMLAIVALSGLTRGMMRKQ